MHINRLFATPVLIMLFIAIARAGFAPFPPLAAPIPVSIGAGQGTPAADAMVYVSCGYEEPRVLLTPATSWQDGEFLVLDVTYDGPRTGIVRLGFWESGDVAPRAIAGFSLLPGVPARIALPLSALSLQATKLARTANTFRNGMRGQAVHRPRLVQVTLELKGDRAEQRLRIHQAALVASAPVSPAHELPLVDALGQWTARTWPGKTRSKAEMISRLQTERAAAATVAFPDGWNGQGGEVLPGQFRGTGYFRVEHDGRRWWLVDPTGAPFFSVGVDVISPSSAGPVLPGTEGLYTQLPALAAGAEVTSAARRIDFLQENLQAAFGETWMDDWTLLTRSRLVGWRFNTVGNWAHRDFVRRAGLPYVTQMGYPTTAITLHRDFPDVFAPEFAVAAEERARVLEATRDDPLLIGYFMTNEPAWGFGITNLAARMLERNPGSHSRRALAGWLRERYHDDNRAWASAWATKLNNFEDVETAVLLRAEQASPEAAADLEAFSRVLIRRYVEIPVRAARAVDPAHLNLGLRYAYLAHDMMLEAGDLFDVFSINAYGITPPMDVVNRIVRITGRPVLIGEFHFGATDSGLASPGLRAVATQADRGAAYAHYVETAAAHPGVVGVHYFQLNDQPLLGRSDGENYQIGLVDVCSQPYGDFVRQVTATNENLYRIARGERPPASTVPRELPNSLIESTPLNATADAARQ